MTSDAKLRVYLKQAAIDLHDAELRLEEAEARRHEPLAILGMSCRYPGGVGSPGSWEGVASGTDGISAFPSDRGWDLEGLYHPDPEHPGSSYARDGGFLYDAGEFDAGFFGISPREALAMDPQQRLLLEGRMGGCGGRRHRARCLCMAARPGCSWASALRATWLGVFGSASAGLEGYRLTGSTDSVASGRVAYTLGLEGPAVFDRYGVLLLAGCLALGCSGAASRGVLDGFGWRRDGAPQLPGIFLEFSRQRGLSSDGRCKSFADGADGTGFSEGTGMLLLGAPLRCTSFGSSSAGCGAGVARSTRTVHPTG